MPSPFTCCIVVLYDVESNITRFSVQKMMMQYTMETITRNIKVWYTLSYGLNNFIAVIISDLLTFLT